jgi:hypothetical protein
VTLSVATYEDLRDGDFNELAHFGKIPNPKQRQAWLNEKGIEQDQENQKEIIRSKTEGGVPQQSVTADKVREIIKQEEKKK